MKSPSWSRRVKLAFDWTWGLLFPRDLGHARTNQTERVTRAHYRPGDDIFLEGSPGAHFYVIASGEVEVLLRDDKGETNQIVDVLGPGEFFGEMALLDNQPRGVTARARTAVDVMVMGRDVFSRISGSLAPFRLLLAQGVRWKRAKLNPRIHQAWQAIQQQPLAAFLGAVPDSRLSPHDTYEDAVDLFDRQAVEFVCVLDQENHLLGVVTRSELFGAFEQGRGPATTVEDFMLTNPIMVTPDQSPLTEEEENSMLRLFKTDDAWSGLVLRLTLGLVMFPHGAQKLLGWYGGSGFDGTMGFFTQKMGLPWIIAFLVIIGECFGSLGLLAGLLTRFAAASFIVIMLGAIATTHLPFGFFMNWFGQQQGEGFEYHLLVIGMSAALLIAGGGKWSTDRMIAEQLGD